MKIQNISGYRYLYLILLLLSLIISDNLSAKKNYLPGYIIDNNNDTIYGLIDYKDWEVNPKKIDFKESDDAKVINCFPSDIAEFHVANSIYQSRITTIDKSPVSANNLVPREKLDDYTVTDTIFLEVIIKGEAELYSYIDKSKKLHIYLKSSDFDQELIYQRYLSENNTRYFEKFKGQLSYALQSCPECQKLIQRSKYDLEEIKEIVAFYNKNTGSTPYYEKQLEETKFEPLLISGLSRTLILIDQSLDIDLSLRNKYLNSINATFGLGLNISLARNRRKFSIYNDLLYTKNSFSERQVYLIGTKPNIDRTVDTYDTEMAITYLKLSNLFRMNFLTLDKGNLFAQAGLCNFFMMNSENTPQETFRNHKWGLAAGMGANSKKLSLEIRGELSDPYSQKSFYASRHKSLYLLLGYWF